MTLAGEVFQNCFYVLVYRNCTFNTGTTRKTSSSSRFLVLFPYPLEVGKNRILDDCGQIYTYAIVSVWWQKVYGSKAIFKKKQKKDPITIFTLNVLDVADGNVLCSFLFVSEIKHKEEICGPFSYKTKYLVSHEKSSPFKKIINLLIQSMKRQAG